MNTIAWVMLGAVLAFGSGCVKPDWIQQTLVTVDVTGVWVGGISRGGSYGTLEIRLDLEQQGAKVTGYLHALPPYPPWGLVNGPVEGTVAGDKFTFLHTNGVLTGETTVDGDEMRINMAASHRIQAVLRRVDSSAPPRSQ
jgi:hypothetical protein